eukprot:UN06488
MYKATRIVHITDIVPLLDERYCKVVCSVDEIFKSEVYEASMDVYNKSLGVEEKKLFAFGQYFWMNIPCISPYEWHPMCCVDSNFHAKECTFIVQKDGGKGHGEGEWCEKVCDWV